MYGWAGKLLRVDLSSGRIEKEPLDYSLRSHYVGGRGINARLIYNEHRPGIDPLDPANVLIFGTGPLVGTIAPSACKLNITALSPLTKILGTANVGGEFPPTLKWAGYDHIIITGKASEPVYLWIDDDKVELRSAKHLWGKTTTETYQLLRDELGPTVESLTIGPAGEKLVKFACIIGKLYRAAARTGMGAVMGSKNLKAVAVRGTKSIKVAKPESFMELVKGLTQRIMNNPFYPMMSVHGTCCLMPASNQSGRLLIRNWQQSGDYGEIDRIDPEAQAKDYYTKSVGCFGCPLHCSHHWKIKQGPFAGEEGGGMEYGSGGFFTSLFENPSLPFAFKSLKVFNAYGMDAIELAAVLAAAFEWYEKGIITKDDTDGLALEWGNQDVMLEMIHRVGRREGFGGLLGEGPVEAARRIGRGAERYLAYSKGMCWTGEDYRSMKGCALAAATCSKGCDLMFGLPSSEYFGMSPEEAKKRYGAEDAGIPISYNKSRVVYLAEAVATAADCVQICKFITEFLAQELGVKEMAELFSAATGIEMDEEAMTEVADRVWNIERAFLVREGISRKDDQLHGQWLEPIKTGPYRGERIDPEKFEKMLDEYYQIRGWDIQTGVPTRAILEKLGLKDIADDLEVRGKIPVP